MATTKFGLVAFSGGVEAYRAELVDAKNDEKSRAIKWLKARSPVVMLDPKASKAEKDKHRGTRADLGLERAFKMRPDTIFFVSDGQPTGTTPTEVYNLVESAQRNLSRPATINAVAYRADSGQGFMRKLAEENRGTFREVN